MDTARHARFERPGHAVTGVRKRTGAERRAGWGYDFAHAVIDDHSRLVYVELLNDERAATVTAFFSRALDWFGARHPRKAPDDGRMKVKCSCRSTAPVVEFWVGAGD
jgi:hypothetical protein